MNTLTKTSLLFIFTLLSFTIKAQTDDLLKKLPNETEEAYLKSEPKVINTINWLNSTPISDDVKRGKQSALLLAWLINTPTVTIEMHDKILTFTKKNPELLLTFMGGWAKYSIENNHSKNLQKCNLAGIKTVLSYYKGGNGLKKDKKVDNLVDLQSAGKLNEWIKKQLNSK